MTYFDSLVFSTKTINLFNKYNKLTFIFSKIVSKNFIKKIFNSFFYLKILKINSLKYKNKKKIYLTLIYD